ncbi:MAG: cobalamin-dependent protein [Clostridia bacterium]
MLRRLRSRSVPQLTASFAKFVDAVRTERPDLLGMSALLTTTMPTMKATIEALKEAGLDAMNERGRLP